MLAVFSGAKWCCNPIRFSALTTPKLLDRDRVKNRLKDYSLRIAMAYVDWIGDMYCIMASVIRLNWGRWKWGVFDPSGGGRQACGVDEKSAKGQRYFQFMLNCFLHSRGPQSPKLCCPDDVIERAFVEK
ncbi:MAG: hypothetical protein IPJ38_02010 [Dechloromonas sp.]|jgi:hypothetical protein|uniref:Uncharacterized protein n=1 Tax=Candidatus Dechloromonas phosphorivorans TaxID=2899244 RepID=A0A935K026_9RHOO|nr:hypothetical protein [Candidatus Dechloromonas phosphorivorans]